MLFRRTRGGVHPPGFPPPKEIELAPKKDLLGIIKRIQDLSSMLSSNQLLD